MVSEALTTADLACLVDQAAGPLAGRLRGKYLAIMLVGAAARGEITTDAEGKLLSDLDLLVVLPQRHILPAIAAEQQCRALLRPWYAEAARNDYPKISVGFASALPRYWRVATPFMWELRANGRVLHGTRAVTQWPAIIHASQIPQWEGIRLVANRMCEALGALGALLGQPAPEHSAANASYACVKLILACSEASLIDCGQYHLSYRERRQRHQHAAQRFSAAQNQLIELAYRAKIDSDWCLLSGDTTILSREAMALAITTLGHFGLTTAHDLARRTQSERPAAPGRLSDLAFFATQRVAGRSVAPRRPIAALYADALALAQALVRQEPSLLDTGALGDKCRQIMDRYSGLPQVVSTLDAGARP